jgi:hypothetical protein
VSDLIGLDGVVPNDLVHRLDPVRPVHERREVVGVRKPGLANLAGVVQLESDPNTIFRSLAPVVLGVTVENYLESIQVACARAGNDEFDIALGDRAIQHVRNAEGQGETNHFVTFL